MSQTTKHIKILVVDDSAFMRLLMTDLLNEDPELQVIGTANDGLEAVEKVKSLKPDLVLMDMEMGEYDGMYAIREIMAQHPVPILILSSVGNTNLDHIFEALKIGAVDYINKPKRSSAKMREKEDELLEKIKNIVRAKPKLAQEKSKSRGKRIATKKSVTHFDIVAIGASTGGPSALEEVIMDLPENLPIPVVISQHMPESFIQPFVNRLNALTPLNIVMGKEFMVPEPGMIIIAPGDANMIVRKDEQRNKIEIGFDEHKYDEYNNPSINALLLSVAEVYGKRAIGVILTGMGRDGVKGLKKIKDNGGMTIAQNKESSVIFGMPKVAIEQNAAMHVLDIKEIGEFIGQNI